MRTMWTALMVVGALAAPEAAAQDKESRSVIYTRDLNGRQVPVADLVAGDGISLQKVRSINGGLVTLEKVEEKVLEKDSTRTVVERVIQRYDPNGARMPPEKVRIEVSQKPDGGSETRTTIYRGDLNGNMVLSERAVSETTRSGGVEQSEARVEKPTINGAMAVVEKSVGQLREAGNGTEQDVMVYRPDASGRMAETNRKITRTTKDGPTVVDEYESASTGSLMLSRQMVTRTVKEGDKERQEVSIYGINAPGSTANGGLKLREVQVIEKKPSGSGSVETFSIRRPVIGDNKTLGPLEKISETVCTGKCS